MTSRTVRARSASSAARWEASCALIAILLFCSVFNSGFSSVARWRGDPGWPSRGDGMGALMYDGSHWYHAHVPA